MDRLEADKESLVNQIYDLRQLMQRVNQQGEKKLTHLKTKNVSQLPLKITDHPQGKDTVIVAGFRGLQSHCLPLRERLLLLELEHQPTRRRGLLQRLRLRRQLQLHHTRHSLTHNSLLRAVDDLLHRGQQVSDYYSGLHYHHASPI